MALKEQDVVLTTKDENGNTVIQMPITRAGNVEDLTNTCLPLSGGTMTGAIEVPTFAYGVSGNAIVGDGVGEIRVWAGDTSKNVEGASLNLYPETLNHPNGFDGGFLINAVKSGASSGLRGSPDGSLTWANQPIERVSSANKNKDKLGYIRYENGLQITWGEISSSSSSKTATFLVPFAKVPVVQCTRVSSSGTIYSIACNPSSTGFAYYSDSGESRTFSFVAIGWWK